MGVEGGGKRGGYTKLFAATLSYTKTNTPPLSRLFPRSPPPPPLQASENPLTFES